MILGLLVLALGLAWPYTIEELIAEQQRLGVAEPSAWAPPALRENPRLG